MFSANQLYYHTDRRNKYVQLFKRELTKNKTTVDGKDFYRFLAFKRDERVRRKENLFAK